MDSQALSATFSSYVTTGFDDGATGTVMQETHNLFPTVQSPYFHSFIVGNSEHVGKCKWPTD